MFTYAAERDSLKETFFKSPFSAIPIWVTNWMLEKIRTLPAGSVVVELGTYVGGTAQMIARANPTITIHSIDLNKYDGFEKHHIFTDLQKRYNLYDLKTSDLLEIQKLHTEDYPNIILHTGESTDLDINNIDVALVDDNKLEEGTLENLRYLWPRIKTGGFVFGDDFDSIFTYNAFVRFAKEKNIELTSYSKGVRIQKYTPAYYRDTGFKDTLVFPTDRIKV